MTTIKSRQDQAAMEPASPPAQGGRPVPETTTPIGNSPRCGECGGAQQRERVVPGRGRCIADGAQPGAARAGQAEPWRTGHQAPKDARGPWTRPLGQQRRVIAVATLESGSVGEQMPSSCSEIRWSPAQGNQIYAPCQAAACALPSRTERPCPSTNWPRPSTWRLQRSARTSPSGVRNPVSGRRSPRLLPPVRRPTD
jgi:hypothetical protein